MKNRRAASALKIALVSALGPLAVACSNDNLQLPSCLSALLASCPPAGTCTYSYSAATTDDDFDACYASGVHAAFSNVQDGTTPGGIFVVAVTTASGLPCYSFESRTADGMAGEGASLTWKDAGGQVVATAISNGYLNPRIVITCAAGGETRSCGNDNPSDGSDGCCIDNVGTARCGYYVGSGTCSLGDCAPAN